MSDHHHDTEHDHDHETEHDHDHDTAHHHPPRQITRHADVAIVGGSAAGLAAAIQLGRQRRSAIVIDAGDPRNAPAAHMHGYLGYDGAAPSDLTAKGRAEVQSYGGEVLAGRVTSVECSDDGGFRLYLTGGTIVTARRVLTATGIVDELPDVAGVREQWGSGVIHCPFCHGYEVRDQRVVMIVSTTIGMHPVSLFHRLTDRLAVVIHDGLDVPDGELEPLRSAGVTVERATASEVMTEQGRVVGVRLSDGRELDADAVVVSPTVRARVEPFETVGLTAQEHPMGVGSYVPVDETGSTGIAGIYAAGNVTDPSQQVLQAAAHGSRVGAMISFDLAAEDLAADARPSANATEWELRYSGEQMWSGNPNGTLVVEAADLTPARALDVGAGEGGDAVWLAEQGWKVVATDISNSGLAKVAGEADRRGLGVECLAVDANTIDAFGDRTFELVSAFYASVPRTPDGRFLSNLLDAVAVGGTLLAVGHDLEPMRAPIDTAERSRAFDPDAYVGVEAIAEAVAHRTGWEVERHEKRARPAGAASAGHHVDDIVFRAKRLR